MEKSIYQMKLHEATIDHMNGAGEISILRVAGGWIYFRSDFQTNTVPVGVFVPFNNEFMGGDKK